MKRILLFVLVLCLLVFPMSASAYTVLISDLVNDSIGTGFETTSITYNVNESPFAVALATQYKLSGLTVGSWVTRPADLLLDGSSNGVGWDYAIPLVAHDGFVAGSLYTIGTLAMSDSFAPLSGGYIYNHNVPVSLKTGTLFGAAFTGTVSNTSTGIGYVANNGWYWSDVGPDFLSIGWGTATCANDPIGIPTPVAPVPEPGTLILLGTGLIGLSTAVRRRRINRMR